MKGLITMSGTNSSCGIGVGSALTIVFVVLKLVGTIDWSWWWILSPVWISVVIGLVVFVVLWFSIDK